uniref:Uncharacterized protein n=1 Tax=Anguilla anguilla TaxID=7936 RepID=A0A0E9SQX1_ANGAN
MSPDPMYSVYALCSLKGHLL